MDMKVTQRTVVIEPPKNETVKLRIRGTAPYVQHKFSKKARETIIAKQRLGDQAKKNKKREARNFENDFKEAQHISREGWVGIPAPAFRAGMISACRLIGFKMTLAKLSVFIEADGFDVDDGTPLVRIIKGEPRVHEGYVRNETGVVDIRWRPMWEEWEADVRVRYDAGQFSAQDVINLMARVGTQVGVGEGRPDSKNSAGQGWGLFEVVGG